MAAHDPFSIVLEVWKGTPIVALAVVLLLVTVQQPVGSRRIRRPRAALVAAALGTAAWIAAGALGALCCALASTLATAAAIASGAAAVWLWRGRVEAGGEDDGGGSRRADGPRPGSDAPSIDWDRFETEFATYAAQRARQTARLTINAR